MKAIVWFRRDLRVRDNETLKQALENFDEVFPIYVFDESEWKETNLGFPKTGSFKTKFLFESVSSLNEGIKELNGKLIIRKGDPARIINSLAQELGVSTVLASKECTTDEIKQELQLEKLLWKNGIQLELIWQSTLYHLSDLPFPISHLPDIFTEFRKKVEKESSVRDEIQEIAPFKKSSSVASIQIPTYSDLGLAEPCLDKLSAFPFRGGEDNAWDRLRDYFWENQHLSNYKNTRNGMIGTEFSSKLSAFLSLGNISARSIYHQVKKYEKMLQKNSSTYWLVFELIWRDFFQFVAKRYNSRLFKVTGIKLKGISYNEEVETFRKWCYGETGQPFIDANMRELLATGYMSNRGRQNVASYLVNDLKINWTWGAMWFESLLIDYDAASNWGNWNYIAGVGNDPRSDRYFNTESQAERYDPKGEFVNRWLDRSDMSLKY
ncbi:MAG: DASH family cryptochrome [bacterium]|nr:DASH family cryptochrome [bacterium]